MKNNTSELLEFLYDSCRKDPDLLMVVLKDHLSRLDEDGLNEIEDLLVNNFGDD